MDNIEDGANELFGLTDEGTRAYVVVREGLIKIQKALGVAVSIEAANGARRATSDYIRESIGPIAAHELLALDANEIWRDVLAAKKRRAA